MPAPVKSTSTAASRCRAFYRQVPGLEPDRVRALSKREAFVASRRRRRQAPEAGAYLRSKYADVPLPAPWSKEDFGKDRFNRLCPRVSTNPEVPSAAGADLRSKYADSPHKLSAQYGCDVIESQPAMRRINGTPNPRRIELCAGRGR